MRRAVDINPANISVLHHHGELLALWEGGSASVLDRDSLEWRGFKVWGAGLEGLPFTGIAVFDAGHVADGPVARAWLDYPLPLAFHGSFTPA